MAKWALIIAIEEYPNIAGNFNSKLPGSNQAALDFRSWVTTVKGVPTPNIVACAAAACSWRTTGTTRKEIRDAFTDVATKSRNASVDEFYVFFTGHGIGYSKDPNDPAIDILIGSDFVNPAASGDACLMFHEIKESLRVALGPGKHFYFIDACRNPLQSVDIRPAILDVVWGRSGKANATTYVLFSTAPGDVARVNSGFGAALLEALRGLERAKTWVGAKMFVTFESLCARIQLVLKKDDLDPEKKGPADGNIVELVPVPMNSCNVEILNATPNDTFMLKIADVRQAQRPPVNFQGSKKTVPVPPEDYFLDLTTSAGVPVLQIVPADSPVDLYENRTVQFLISSPGTPPSVPPTPILPESTVHILGIPNTELLLDELSTGLPTTIAIKEREQITKLKPGSYKATVRDGNFELASKTFTLLRGATFHLDFEPEASSGAHTSLLNVLPNRGALIDFSETLSDVPDWNLSLWLALIGASRILDAPESFSKLKNLSLMTFEKASPGKSVLYILAGEKDSDQSPVWTRGINPEWTPMQAVSGIKGLFQQQLEFNPGPLLFTYGFRGQTLTVQTYGLADRATFLTFATQEGKPRQVQQFILPIYSLFNRLSDRELEYLKRTPPLPRIRYMSTAQRLFALQSPIAGQSYKQSDHYWFDLLYHKWLDPIMAIIACYELIRRGAADDQHGLMSEVLVNMREYFPNIPDTEIIAKLLGEPNQLSKNPPLLLDGLMALSTREGLPLPAANLDFNGIWTMWRNALALPDNKVTLSTPRH
jgi:caspase domain-containing protein